MRTFVLMLLIQMGLRLVSFAVLRRLIVRVAVPMPIGQTDCSIERITWAINVAGRYLRTACLVRALVAYIFLRRQGYLAELRIGVQYNHQQPLIAHAWVEVQGSVVIGALPDLACYTILPNVLPMSSINQG